MTVAWISIIDDKKANSEWQKALAFARTPHGTVDNVMRIHSHRPNSMYGHHKLYRAALHDEANTLPPWLQETISSYVSLLNDCDYSYANHWKNAVHLMDDPALAARIEIALAARRPEDAVDGRELALLRYAEKLTLTPGDMQQSDVIALRNEGLDDGQILEANQIICYFNYVNRCLNGLGVTTEGDVIGFYPE